MTRWNYGACMSILRRRQGIARRMLQFAEDECRRRRIKRLELSTAEIQYAAIALSEGYRLVRQETAETASNKAVGSGIRRSYFEKVLWRGNE
jgi:GNAT superfamily N-acetyltransferase